MRIALVRPNALPPDARLAERLEGVRLRFGADCTIADGELSALHDALHDFDHVVTFWEDERSIPHRNRRYRVSNTGRVVPVASVPIDTAEEPYLLTHAFNRHGPRGSGDTDYYGFQFFPYGYTFRVVGAGPVDPFGHRIEGDFRRFAQRQPHQRLVLCFGGSAVWGTTVLAHQSFPAVLERHLAARAEALGMQVSVLNFGIPGATVLNAMQRFLLFAIELKPDLVICHDGVNDLFYGYSSDPWLVQKHDIAYQNQFEQWARALHQPPETAVSAGTDDKMAPAPPLSILRAYLRRKREFVRLVQAFGAQVLSGLQPVADSKAALSDIETARLRAWEGEPSIYAAEFALINGCYGILARERPDVGTPYMLDFHHLFSSFGAEATLMADRVHLEPEGERVVAQAYAAAAWPILERNAHVRG